MHTTCKTIKILFLNDRNFPSYNTLNFTIFQQFFLILNRKKAFLVPEHAKNPENAKYHLSKIWLYKRDIFTLNYSMETFSLNITYMTQGPYKIFNLAFFI